jgi:hypothetical protein
MSLGKLPHSSTLARLSVVLVLALAASAPSASAAAAGIRRAERGLAYRVHLLHRCLRHHPRHPGRCRAARHAVRRDAVRLAKLKQSASAAPSRAAVTPATARPPTPIEATAASQPTTGSFEMGAEAGSATLWELPWLQTLGAHTARMEFEVNAPVSKLEPIVEGYARAGIRPLLLATFTGRVPSTAEAQNVATWAAAFGPGGSFWRGRNLPAGTAVTDIEFGNETNNPYQFGESSERWFEASSFIQRAEAYARRLRDAQIAIAQTGAQVGLLGIADEYGGHTSWDEAMFRAVPDLGQRVAGWTAHPYGPNWRTTLDGVIANTQAAGAPALPIYVTEWGLSSDNGRCLDDNFGWNPCMTYQEAATVLGENVAAMRARYGSRLRAFYLFQARDQRPTGTASDREYYFGALQSNRAPKGAYTAEVQSLLAENP